MGSDESDVVIDEEGESPEKALAGLRRRLKVALAEKQDYLNGWQRAKADFVNLKRDADEALRRGIEIGEERVLSECLSLLGLFDIGMQGSGWETGSPTFKKGVEAIYKEYEKMLARFGVLPIDETGVPFDPTRHEAIDTQHTNDQAKENIVVAILAKGHRRGEKVLSPAKVRIASTESNQSSNS